MNQTESEQLKIKCRQLEREAESYKAIAQNLGDYTQRIAELNQQIRLLTKREQAFFNAINDPVLVINLDRKILHYNRTAQETFPIDKLAESNNSLECSSIVKCNHCHKKMCVVQKLKNSDLNSIEIEAEVTRKNGEKFPAIISASPVYNSPNQIESIVVSYKDITKRKRTEEELVKYKERLEEQVKERTVELTDTNEQLQQEISERKRAEERLKSYAAKLENSNRELQDFAYVASHDLQEPLRKIQAFSDRLKSKCGESLTEQGRDYLNRMQNTAERMEILITDLLTYSRVTTRTKPFVPVNMDTTVKEVLSDLEVQIEELKAKVEIVDLPIIDADPLQMRQLMQNLVVNALKFHKKDESPVLKIKSTYINSEDYHCDSGSNSDDLCQISVEDNGIGFDDKYSQRIFGVFQRLHGRSEYKGSGVGLSVCQKIVDRHGGNITAKSQPGQGAKFLITLPVNQKMEKH